MNGLSHTRLAISRSTFALAAVLLALPAWLGARAAADEKRFECMGIGGGGQMYGTGISPHKADLMHVSCDMGTFYVTDDGGKSWNMVDQLEMVGSRSCRPAYHPTDPNVVYMPYYRDGRQIRVSRDRGRHWEALCEAVPWPSEKGRDKFDENVISIDLDPAAPARMFVSTPAGLYRSADGGKTFAKCGDVAGIALKVHVSPAGARCVAGTSKGVYVSADGGTTWAGAGEGLPADGMFGFCAATDKDGATHCYAAYDGAVYVSHDSGRTFQQAKGLPKTPFRFASMADTDVNTAYVSNLGGDFGVWKTADGGASWKRVFGPGEPGIRWGWLGTDYTKGFGGRANCITVAPRDPGMVLYVNTAELFLTRDGGTTWQEGCSAYRGGDPNRIEKSQPWAGIGLEVALPTDMIRDPYAKDRVYLVYGDIGFLISEDRGKSWRRNAKGIPKEWVNRMYALVPDPERKGVLYAACTGQHGSPQDTAEIKHQGGVVLSTDHGESWKTISDGLPTTKFPCTDLALDAKSPADARTLYCVMQNDGVYKSVDGGKSWAKKSTGVGREDNHNVEQVEIGPDGALYALVMGRADGWNFHYSGGGLWTSSDGGETWVEITKGLDLANPKYFAVDPRDAKHLYLGTTQAPKRESAGLWETKDGGKSWKQVLGVAELGRELYGFVHSGDVVFHPTKPNLIYYSTKTHGTWITRDAGATWRRMLGIPRLATGKIIVDPDDPNVICVCSVGLWKGPAEGY